MLYVEILSKMLELDPTKRITTFEIIEQLIDSECLLLSH